MSARVLSARSSMVSGTARLISLLQVQPKNILILMCVACYRVAVSRLHEQLLLSLFKRVCDTAASLTGLRRTRRRGHHSWPQTATWTKG